MSAADAGTGLKSDGGAGPGRPGPALAGHRSHEGLDDAQGAQARASPAGFTK